MPGRSAPLDAQYFRRIAAIEFAVKHDDGRGADDLHQADVVLIGVSRTSKTPTSMHLGYLGLMAANVPIVRGVDPPPVLFTVEPWKLVGLTIDAEQLAGIRRRRVRALAGAGARYADLAEIYEELEFTARAAQAPALPRDRRHRPRHRGDGRPRRRACRRAPPGSARGRRPRLDPVAGDVLHQQAVVPAAPADVALVPAHDADAGESGLLVGPDRRGVRRPPDRS